MIRDLVERMLEEHGGGEAYFDNLDSNLRNPWVFRALTESAWAMFGPALVVVSGKFGEAYRRWANAEFIRDPVIVLSGGVRKGGAINAPEYVGGVKMSLVFIDDSYYQGRTYLAVREALGERVLGAFVAYDGSPEPHPDVYSLYRWRDRCASSKSSSSPEASSDSTPSGASTAATTSL
jgi:hypothetical protein